MSDRPSLFMRRAGLLEWLGPLGFSERQVEAMIEANVIPRRYLNPGGKKRRAHYRRDEVAAALGLKEGEA